MSVNRKLQAEIDRVLKRVAEGIAEFDVIWEKVHKATTPNLKEKYEGDLKKEIKKLQRYRDQIKSWASSSEIKNKRPLLEARKNVEKEMERFKILEKESKTKAYSKEGLAQRGKKKSKADPRDKVYEWIEEKQSELKEQLEEFEEQFEEISESAGKRKKGNNEQLENLNHWISRHNWHVSQLSTVKDRLEKKEISIKQAQRIEDDLEYYISDNQEPQFVEDEYLYDAIDEDDSEEDADEAEDEPEPESEPQPEPKKVAKTKAKTVPVKAAATKKKVEKKDDKGKVSVKAEKKGVAKATKSGPAVKQPVSKTQKSIGAQKSKPAVGGAASGEKKIENAKLNVTAPEWQRARSAATMLKNQEQIRTNHQQKLMEAKSLAHQQASLGHRMAHDQGRLSQVPLHHSKSAGAGLGMHGQRLHAQQSAVGIRVPELHKGRSQGGIGAGGLPVRKGVEGGLGTKKEVSPLYLKNLRLLESSLRHMPEPMDTERPKQYVPRNPYRTLACFPSMPAPIFDDPNIFEKFDRDTLFFIFYFQQGTQHQYLAARELKKQSWRYHKKFLTWFMRHDDPKFTNEEYEQGTYVYFDYESGWCKRIKTDFTFEYCHLEDELKI